MRLITFGDSWVFGVGTEYREGMSSNEYQKIAWVESPHCFRNLLSTQLGLENLNHSVGESSNQKQFRLALDTFFGKNKIVLQSEDIVLWGITSVYRTELWNENEKKWQDISIPSRSTIAKILAVNYHNEGEELKVLENQIHLWNSYFQSQNVKNYWFNIFNDHKWDQKISNFLFEGSSLLSCLIDDYSQNDKYHRSDWNDTDRKIKRAREMNLVNPLSGHPNKLAHKRLADLIGNKLDSKTGAKVD